MLKNTKTRNLVKATLEEASIPLSAYDLYNKLKNSNITLSSIYRTLDTFTKEKIIIKDTNSEGVTIYTLHNNDHNHYLECKNCHKQIKLDYCPYHSANEKINKNNKFEVDEKNIIIYGTCQDCKK